jgi:hypothetical protein
MYAKLIMDQITDENERYYIYWNAWKKCASEVENDSAFTNTPVILLMILLMGHHT